MMQHAESTRVINAPFKDVWRMMADVTEVEKYHPDVDHITLHSQNKTGNGAARVCHFYDGTSIKEEVIEANENDGHLRFFSPRPPCPWTK